VVLGVQAQACVGGLASALLKQVVLGVQAQACVGGLASALLN
jgi:hypothetical protein